MTAPVFSIEHNAGTVAVAIRGQGNRIYGALAGELRTLAERVAASMRLASPKFRSLLANSVRFQEVSVFEWFIGPHTDYARWVEEGRKPGKGLPRFSDPAAASIVAWLEGRIHDSKLAFSGPLQRGQKAYRGRPRKNTMAAVRANLELRDRYMALSRYVRHHGIKAQPFVADTAAEYREIVPRAIDAAVRRALEGGAA